MHGEPPRVLVVAFRTAVTPKLLGRIRERAGQGACSFTLLVPRPYWDPDTEEAAITLELAIPALSEAAGSRVEGRIGATDPFVAVREELERESYQEVIISTLPTHLSRWLRLDLPHRVEQLGISVAVVTPSKSPAAGDA